MPIWWRRARFSSSRAARERKIENRVANSIVRESCIGRENYETTITLISSDVSRFSRGTGMLGGMPVAIASGMALTRMRLKAGLDPPIAPRNIAEACVRDTDPLEQDLLERSQVQQLSVADIRQRSERLQQQMKRLSEMTDAI